MIGVSGLDPLVDNLGPLCEIDDWKAFLSVEPDRIDEIRTHTRTGRPLGSKSFLDCVEVMTCYVLCKQRPGPRAGR